MARQLRTAVTLDVPTGALEALTSANASGGENFANDGRTFVYVSNGSASPITVTFTVVGKYKGFTITNPGPTVAAGAKRLFGPFPQDVFNQSDGTVWIDWSAATSVSFQIYTLLV